MSFSRLRSGKLPLLLIACTAVISGAMLMELFTPHGHGTLIYDPSGAKSAQGRLVERRRAAARNTQRG